MILVIPWEVPRTTHGNFFNLMNQLFMSTWCDCHIGFYWKAKKTGHNICPIFTKFGIDDLWTKPHKSYLMDFWNCLFSTANQIWWWSFQTGSEGKAFMCWYQTWTPSWEYGGIWPLGGPEISKNYFLTCFPEQEITNMRFGIDDLRTKLNESYQMHFSFLKSIHLLQPNPMQTT